MIVTMSGIACWVPDRWPTYTEKVREQVADHVESLARSGADQFTLHSVTPRDNGRAKLSYGYSIPPNAAVKKHEGHPR